MPEALIAVMWKGALLAEQPLLSSAHSQVKLVRCPVLYEHGLVLQTSIYSQGWQELRCEKEQKWGRQNR